MREGAHERNDSFAFFELDFRVFYTPYLVVDEAVEET